MIIQLPIIYINDLGLFSPRTGDHIIYGRYAEYQLPWGNFIPKWMDQYKAVMITGYSTMEGRVKVQGHPIKLDTEEKREFFIDTFIGIDPHHNPSGVCHSGDKWEEYSYNGVKLDTHSCRNTTRVQYEEPLSKDLADWVQAMQSEIVAIESAKVWRYDGYFDYKIAELRPDKTLYVRKEDTRVYSGSDLEKAWISRYLEVRDTLSEYERSYADEVYRELQEGTRGRSANIGVDLGSFAEDSGIYGWDLE